MPETAYEILDEGSWALMIEESNARALADYQGSMANLGIDYYLSIGQERYYKGYFRSHDLNRIREGIVRFLADDNTYSQCVTDIHRVMRQMDAAADAYAELSLAEKFQTYSKLLREYISYYNSVITDTFYLNVFEIVDTAIDSRLNFAAKGIKDSLFATDNNGLLTHLQTVDMLELARKNANGTLTDEEVDEFVDRYRSITTSSSSPQGMSAEEVRDHVAQQSVESIRTEAAFLDNLHFRYSHSNEWSERTAAVMELDESVRTLIRRTCELSFLKIRMREEFQKFKIVTRQNFLSELIAEIGKQQFDFMLIEEIADYIDTGSRVPEAEIARRQGLCVFELSEGKLSFLDEVPEHVDIVFGDSAAGEGLVGDVLAGTGKHRYTVFKVQQDEEGLTAFDRLIGSASNKGEVAVITNVLRPHLVPKLRRFGALLTQYGGYTSHASVLCRELGINSMISVTGLLDRFETEDIIEVDFELGTVRKVAPSVSAAAQVFEPILDLRLDATGEPRRVGSKAANLMKIRDGARIANGFVVTSEGLRLLDDRMLGETLRDRVDALNCDRVVIRSSHQSEDGVAGSFAGLFESFVNVDTKDTEEMVRLVRAVSQSQHSDAIDSYGQPEGDMSVVVQEMIAADVSGVALTSSVHDGLDYLLLEYVAGDLSFLMQGDVTPISTFVKKIDVLEGVETPKMYPAALSSSLEEQFVELTVAAMQLETLFGRRVEIEWGIRDRELFIYQVRPY